MGFKENRDAQFMLLAGFIIAIGLVITTIMINSIFYESSLAIDAGNDPSKYEIVNLMEITRDEIRNAYRNGTEVGTSQDCKMDNFTKQMQNFSAHIPYIYAQYGEGVNVTWDISSWNDTIHANFTKNGMPGGAANWSVVENVRNTTVFEFSAVNVRDYFLVNVTNASGRIWSMNFSRPDIIVINKTGGVSTYTFDSYIDVLNVTYEFNTSTYGEIYSINFVNGDRAWGNYAIIGEHTSYNKAFICERHYVLNTALRLSTSRMRANITIPVTVPW